MKAQMQATCFAPLYKVVRQPVWRLRRTSLGQPSVGSSQAARPSAGRLFQDLRPLPGFSPHSKPMWRHARRAGLGGADYGLSQASDSLIEENYVPKGALLSTKLPSDVRKRAQDAIAKRGYSVTVGDVAAAAGLTLAQAESALKALAADSNATLQVSPEGEILYAFKPGFREGLEGRSLLLRLEPAAAALVQGTAYLARVAFGTALIASVVTVYLAITVASSGSRDDNNNRGRQSGGGGAVYYGGGGPRIWFNLSDLLWYWDPFYYRHRRERLAAKGGMGFLEAIFSFVFGDGDPNADYDKKRWQAIGRYIQSRGGVVAAEEVAPFLDVTPGQVASDRGRVTLDESYMLPVLARLGGEPQVDSAGNLLYSFPSLQQTGAVGRPPMPPAKAALEQPWKLTEASGGQVLGVVALGVANLAGVLTLGGMLQSPASAYSLAVNGMSWVLGAMPLLQAYAFSFFLIPAWRWLQNRLRNSAIEARNEARLEAAALVQSPDATLAAKQRSAAQQAQQRVLTARDAIFRTDREMASQPRDLEGDLFEERLARRERERREAERAQQQRQRGGY